VPLMVLSLSLSLSF